MSKLLVFALASLLIFFSINGVAQTDVTEPVETAAMTGKGIDGNACAVTAQFQGDELKGVELKGAAKVFEILAENSNSYGPETRIEAQGAEKVLSLLQSNPELFAQMERSEGYFSDTVTYTLDTSTLPSDDEDLGGLKMVFELEFEFDGPTLTEVKATTKAKALLVTLASSRFYCGN